MIFKVRSVEKSITNRKKIDAKCDVKNDPPKKREKQASGSNFDVLGGVLDGPGRPRSVSRAAQDDPKSWGRLRGERFVTLLGALGRFFAFFCDFDRFLADFSSIFGRFFVDLGYEKLCNEWFHFTLVGGGKPRWPSSPAQPAWRSQPSLVFQHSQPT